MPAKIAIIFNPQNKVYAKLTCFFKVIEFELESGNCYQKRFGYYSTWDMSLQRVHTVSENHVCICECTFIQL